MRELLYCEALRTADNDVTCYKMGQWHDYSTVLRDDREIFIRDEPTIVQRSYVVCTKCGSILYFPLPKK